MIISASRRTDIPAFYGEWFLNRIREGFVCVRSPFRHSAVSRVSLRREDVDAIAFWTKNPGPFLCRLDELDRLGYRYYFQVALNAYGPSVERNLPGEETLIENFCRLSDRIGSSLTQWRYSPVVMTPALDEGAHRARFERLAARLAGRTQTCIVSFLDEYPKLKGWLAESGAYRPDEETAARMLTAFRDIVAAYGMELQTCTESVRVPGVSRLGCINREILRTAIGAPVSLAKDKGQRPACACVSSVDIGAYDSCANGCLYCYAGRSVGRASLSHDADSPLLLGRLEPGDIVTERQAVSAVTPQLGLFGR